MSTRVCCVCCVVYVFCVVLCMHCGVFVLCCVCIVLSMCCVGVVLCMCGWVIQLCRQCMECTQACLSHLTHMIQLTKDMLSGSCWQGPKQASQETRAATSTCTSHVTLTLQHCRGSFYQSHPKDERSVDKEMSQLVGWVSTFCYFWSNECRTMKLLTSREGGGGEISLPKVMIILITL